MENKTKIYSISPCWSEFFGLLKHGSPNAEQLLVCQRGWGKWQMGFWTIFCFILRIYLLGPKALRVICWKSILRIPTILAANFIFSFILQKSKSMGIRQYPTIKQDVSLNYWPYHASSALHQHNASYDYYKVITVILQHFKHFSKFLFSFVKNA